MESSSHHRLDADLPVRGIERIAYVNADQRAESLTPASFSSYVCGHVYHSLDGVHSGPAFPEPELVLRKTVLPDQETEVIEFIFWYLIFVYVN